MDLPISEPNNWLKRIDSRWDYDTLKNMSPETKVNLIIPEQYSDVEENIRTLKELMQLAVLDNEKIRELAKKIILERNDSESQKEKEINDVLYDELKTLES